MVLDAGEIQQVRDIIKEELNLRRLTFKRKTCPTEE